MMDSKIASAIRVLGEAIDNARPRLTPLARQEMATTLNMLGLIVTVSNAHALKRLYDGLPEACKWRR